MHLVAIAGRLGIEITLEDFQRISAKTPFIANIRPSGDYLMEDFYYAGGLPAVMKELLPLLHRGFAGLDGILGGENVSQAECFKQDVIRPLDQPLNKEGGTLILYGNLAPQGAVIKHTAATASLLQHRGPAFVFDNYYQMLEMLDSDDLAVTEQHVLVLKNGGPIGGPGFPEWGHIPMPKVLLKKGVKDMVRISDARMSGTSFGTVVLHIAPESAIGGPLAIVQNGDEIVLDAASRRIDLNIPAGEMERRLKAFVKPKPYYERGYGKMFLEHVTQAPLGCDFDFLQAVKR